MKSKELKTKKKNDSAIDFNLNLRTRDRKVMLTVGINTELDPRILFSVISMLKEREIQKGKEVEGFHEFKIMNDRMKYLYGEKLIKLPCRTEPVIIYALREEDEEEEIWVLMLEDEYDSIMRWDIGA